MKINDFAISATSHPIALAGSCAVQVELGRSFTVQENPLSTKKSCTFFALSVSCLHMIIT